PANNVESNQANSVISSNNIVADNTKTNRESEPGQHETKSSLHTIYSPIVGTFYKAPSPDSEPYVEIGTHVSAGNTLCIIEAMKLMNEIESDISGTVVKILIENAQAVEFNQPLFIIKPD
ncbi:MAG: acetyl-CoA carboxylase biotin carboxyl carrier protein, partial [Ignavibacteriae bacterium]|nr:acetyl-CoA carboxylase biotin carboxyl carrier protein [Ignavibacteriota bacterium]